MPFDWQAGLDDGAPDDGEGGFLRNEELDDDAALGEQVLNMLGEGGDGDAEEPDAGFMDALGEPGGERTGAVGRKGNGRQMGPDTTLCGARPQYHIAHEVAEPHGTSARSDFQRTVVFTRPSFRIFAAWRAGYAWVRLQH